jgi:putative transposase
MVLATLVALLPLDRWKVLLATPRRQLRWHRELIRLRWTHPVTGRHGGLDPDVVDLVLRLARDNDRWANCTSRECRTLSVNVSATSLRTILRRHHLGSAPRRGGPSWTPFRRCTCRILRPRWLEALSSRGIDLGPTLPRPPCSS